MTDTQLMQFVIYCLFILLFPLGAAVARGWERTLMVSFMFIYSFNVAMQWRLEPVWLFLVICVVPIAMLALGRVLYGGIVAREKGKMGSTPARRP